MGRKIRIALILISVAMMSGWLISSEVMALTNEERIQMLDDKFIRGEISEKTYLELKKKYGGETTEGSKEKQAETKEAKPVVTENIVKNCSFEESVVGRPANWRAISSSLKYGVDNSTAHSGNSSLKISCPNIVRGYHVTQELAFEPGKSYLVSFWFKGENVVPTKAEGAVIVRLDYYDGTKYKAFRYVEPVPKSKQVPAQWQAASKIVKVPSNAEAGKGRIELRLWDGTGTLWYDDVVVKLMP